MKVREVPISRLDAADMRRWRDLVERAREPNPCYEPEFLRPAAAALGPADMRLVVGAHKGRWIALLPIERLWVVRRLPLPALAAWTRPLTFLDTPLVDGQHVEQAAEGLVGALTGTASGAGLLIRRLGDGPVARALEEAGDGSAPAVRLAEYSRAAVDRRDGSDEGGTVPTSIDKRIRRIERAIGPVSVRDGVGEGDQIATFLALETSGWKGRNGTALARSPAQAEFFRQMAEGFSDLGRLQVLSLYAGEVLLAMKVNVIFEDTVFHLKTSYDERFARLSPGRLLELMTLHRFHENDQLRFMDSCASPSGSILDDIWPARRRMVTLLMPSGATVGRLARYAVERRRREVAPAPAPAGAVRSRPEQQPETVPSMIEGERCL
jgi:CelD/BcsL family acetyltransferase involved in cellulose biosynthesis